MGKDNTTIPPCTPPQALYLHGQINDDPYHITEYDVDCKWHPQPLIGFQKHRDSDTGAELPNCCKHHKIIAIQAAEWFSIFPNCCDHHKSLAEAGKLKKEQYKFVPVKIVQLVAQTEHVIEESISKPDWEKAITGYIDYCFVSFGLYAVGLNIYLDSIKRYVTSSEDMPEKTKIITDYIIYVGANYKFDVLSTEFFEYPDQTVKKWLELFPFHLQRFKNYRHAAAIITVPLPYNTAAKCYSFNSLRYQLDEAKLLDFAYTKTVELIQEFHSSSLLSKGLLTDVEKTQIEIAGSELDLSLKKLQAQIPDGEEPSYVGLIERWIEAEKTYLREIAPVISKRPDLVPNYKEEKPLPEGLLRIYQALKERRFHVSSNIDADYSSADQDTESSGTISPTRKIIEEYFEQIGSKETYGWEYAFRNKADYDQYVSLLERHFQLQENELPRQTINLRPGTKSQVAIVLGTIHKELGEKLKGDEDFFNVVRVLNHFHDVNDEALYKDLSRKRD